MLKACLSTVSFTVCLNFEKVISLGNYPSSLSRLATCFFTASPQNWINIAFFLLSFTSPYFADTLTSNFFNHNTKGARHFGSAENQRRQLTPFYVMEASDTWYGCHKLAASNFFVNDSWSIALQFKRENINCVIKNWIESKYNLHSNNSNDNKYNMWSF